MCAQRTLDRFLIRDGLGWSDGVIQNAFVKFASNHLSISLSTYGVMSGSHLFHFFNTWCDNSELRSVVKEEWDKYRGSSENLWGRLKAIKEAVKRWQQD